MFLKSVKDPKKKQEDTLKANLLSIFHILNLDTAKEIFQVRLLIRFIDFSFFLHILATAEPVDFSRAESTARGGDDYDKHQQRRRVLGKSLHDKERLSDDHITSDDEDDEEDMEDDEGSETSEVDIVGDGKSYIL